MLQELQHEVIGIAGSSYEAEQILAMDNPDIALIDINLKGDHDGISLARSIRDKYDIPLIFITSYSDRNTVERAKQVRPDGYIVKPFAKEDLYTSIEIAVFNHARSKGFVPPAGKDESMNIVLRDSIFIRKDYMLIKIKFDDLIWIRSEMNYLELYCRDNKHLIRSTLKDFVEKLPADIFLQVHKSFAINMKHISAIDHSHIWLTDVRVPIGRSYLDAIKTTLNLDI
jgi:DNA-binding LytR/AlgR family response regulator